MRKTSKVLALFLAVVMTFSLFTIAISAYEFDHDHAGVKITYKDTSGKVIGSAKAGNIIDVVLSMKTFGYVQAFTFKMFYDYTALTQVRRTSTSKQSCSNANAGEWLGDFNDSSQVELSEGELFEIDDENEGYGYYNKYGKGAKQVTVHVDAMYPAAWTDAQKAQYKGCQTYYTADPTDQQLLPNSEGEWLDVIRYRFYVEKDTTLDENTIIFETATGADAPFVNYASSDLPFSVLGGTSVILRASTEGAFTFEYSQAASGPKVDKSAAQLKFFANGTNQVKDEYWFRVKSVITEADWTAYFANSGIAGQTKNAITNVGIVAYKGTTGFDADTAKAVVGGTPATGYSVAETDYVQKTETDAYFGAIIKLDKNTCDYDFTYMGFVKYLDATGATQVIFYDAEYTAAVYSGYASYVSNWNAQYNNAA